MFVGFIIFLYIHDGFLDLLYDSCIMIDKTIGIISRSLH